MQGRVVGFSHGHHGLLPVALAHPEDDEFHTTLSWYIALDLPRAAWGGSGVCGRWAHGQIQGKMLQATG